MLLQWETGRGGDKALFVGECFNVVALAAGIDKVESLWARIKEKASRTDILVGICYRQPNQDEETDEVFCEHLAKAV